MNPTFTDEQHAARWLAKFALPFVNATPDQLRKTASNAYAWNTFNGICRCDGTDKEPPKVDFERNDTYKRVTDQELTDLQKLVKTMLYIVLSGKRHEDLPKDVKQQVKEIEKAIESVFTSTKYNYEWKGKGKAHTLRKGKKGDGLISRLKEWFIVAITTCLYSFSLSDDIEPMKGAGFEKIGMCQKCEIFFEKKRRDQEYCSKRCRDADAAKRMYYRKKETS